MTDTQFYADMDALATELLTDFGSPATNRTVPAPPKPNEQGVVVKPAPVDQPGLAVRTTNQLVQQMFEQAASVVLVVKFPTEPVLGSLILHGGQTWKLQELKPVKPLGTSMLVGFASCVEP